LKNARVTTPNLSRISPKRGLEASTTTAFCTVERVTSASLERRADAAIWRLQLGEDWRERRKINRDGDYETYEMAKTVERGEEALVVEAGGPKNVLCLVGTT
jgi:hypothetical protein